jgi:drug/metabolite transporter superfamily protein YnfA
MKYAVIFGLLLVATTLEASGDAIIRVGLNTAGVPTRIFLMLAGATILFCYGLTLNLAPVDFGRLIGAYVATFFVVAQIINLIVFKTPPSLPIVAGGLFILTGGAIITLWQR